MRTTLFTIATLALFACLTSLGAGVGEQSLSDSATLTELPEYLAFFGLFGGNKKTKSRSSSSSQSTFDPFVTQHAQDISGRVSALGGRGFTPYSGDLSATYEDGRTHSGLHSRGFDLAGDTDNPFLSQLSGVTREGLSGTPFDPATAGGYVDMFRTASEPALAEVDRTLAKNLNTSRANAGSAFGGSRSFLADSAIAGEGARAKGNILSNAITSGLNFGARQHQQNIANRMGAVSALGGLASTHQGIRNNQIGNLLNAGNTEVGLDQSALDRAYGDFRYNTETPYNLIGKEASILASLPKNQYNQSRGTNTKTTPTDNFGKVLGLGGTLLGGFLGGPGGAILGQRLFGNDQTAAALSNIRS